MVEHGVFVFEVSKEVYLDLKGEPYMKHTHACFYDFQHKLSYERFLLSSNLRALNDSGKTGLLLRELGLINQLYYYNPVPLITPTSTYWAKVVEINYDDYTIEEILEHMYFTLHFICDRGVTHEFVRHRPCSFAQESTRYCNYSKDKYGNELTFIEPFWLKDADPAAAETYLKTIKATEDGYLKLIADGWTPQEARSVLPNSLKTELIITTNLKEWNHIFDLRYLGTTGAPHPQAKEVAEQAYFLIYDTNLKKKYEEQVIEYEGYE